MFLYGSRLFISIADMCGYVYTPEVYPTNMRGIGLGACSGAARIGCMITPFVAMVSRRTENSAIGLLQLTITWYKIRHAGGQAHYYSPTGTLKQRQVKLDWFRSLGFNVPVGE